MTIALLLIANIVLLALIGWGVSAFGPRATEKPTAIDLATGDVMRQQEDGSYLSVSGSGRRLQLGEETSGQPEELESHRNATI
ncbi:MAG: hypothetical protein MJ135_04095 [Oscillospiraceae bacterium]|nr:hypothetical protein [Oscillospiraceae bacterium]